MAIMKKVKWRRILLATAAFLIIATVFVWFVYRPWALHWGSTDAEIAGAMTGDELLANPIFDATRAVTILADPEHIWPWIVQIGYRKAGFYSYDRLDNDGIHSAEAIIPEYQSLMVGDMVPIAPGSFVKVASMEPNRSMLFVFQSSGDWTSATWAWELHREGSRKTRLVTRLRASPLSIKSRLLMDHFEIFMMRKCMLGIKKRAENLAQGS
jgi:hypothetical protein